MKFLFKFAIGVGGLTVAGAVFIVPVWACAWLVAALPWPTF